MRERGKFIWKEKWYSICSAHIKHDEDCPRCQVGQWKNVLSIWYDDFLYKYSYPLWYYKANGSFPPRKP